MPVHPIRDTDNVVEIGHCDEEETAMREIKFTREYKGKVYNVATRSPKHKDAKGWHTSQGYIYRLVTEHPFLNCRGYVREHRLIMEEALGRFLEPFEFVHHIDQNRANNDIKNLRLEGKQSTHAKYHLRGKRNPHGQFVAQEPIFTEIKFRLLNKDTGLTDIYTLKKLIATTWRKGNFSFRGRFTGLHDKNGKEIYEGDILSYPTHGGYYLIKWLYEDEECGFGCEGDKPSYNYMLPVVWKEMKVVGNIYENPELLKGV